jgi:diguanylate cyclase (GGDEF)-like protein
MSILVRPSEALRWAHDLLPKGGGLPPDVWRKRHRSLLVLLWLHVGGIVVFGVLTHHGLAHLLGDSGLVAIFAMAASGSRPGRMFRSSMAAIGLVMTSAVLVHLSGGLIEMHFHFFVMVGIMTLYQDWLPFLCAIGFVLLHHTVLGALAPQTVYDHPDAVAHPFRWALIHAGFVLAASVASVTAWRLNEEQALKDSLTKLPNRRVFQERLDLALARYQRRPMPLAVLFIDLDGFKYVNDSHGHVVGDQLLQLVAERLRAEMRAGDVAARFGGDEFAVLLEGVEGDCAAADVAARLIGALALPFEVRGKAINVSASIGIALARPGVSSEDMLRNADLAMYAVKAKGRGWYELFESSMHRDALERLQLDHELRDAIEEHQFVLHFQPVVELRSGRLAGFEALLRWQHPTRGLLAPDAFLGLAEETGAIIPIGRWVLDEACRVARLLRDRYPDRPCTMAINLSPRQVFEDRIVDEVSAVLVRHGVSAADVTLEVTESIMIDNSAATLGRLRALKSLGVTLAVDDFGTGYSSLAYLRQFPFDILKIDKGFVDGIVVDETEAALAVAIITLARTLGLETVAEGIEDPQQAAMLLQLGCDYGQGHHFARALDIDAVHSLFALRAGSTSIFDLAAVSLYADVVGF